mmetsp:Transcript_44242/g.76753  ORF Transcript_44242/g.76753 Transcript_44242/m.76753 type:complete len:380 (+) Transcript_44242:88-1227(+)
MAEDWCTIESDPGVFTALCEDIGVSGIQFEELYSLEADALDVAVTSNVLGLIFLFNSRGRAVEQQRAASAIVEGENYGLFFMKQVVQNACATQAILSVLLNAPADKLDLGTTLKDFREFTAGLDPETRGLALSNSDHIRTAHNDFRRRSSFEIYNDKEKDNKKRDAFHFVGYICHERKIFELDGCQQGPILIGELPTESPWLPIALEEIKRRVASYTEAAQEGSGGPELRFNLLAIVPNKLRVAEKAIERARLLRQRATISLISQGEDLELLDEIDDDDAADDVPSFDELSGKEVPALREIVAKCTSDISEESKVVEEEKRLRSKWAKENALRKHDMVPVALCALRHLARKRQLLDAFEKGKAIHLKRVEEKKKAEAAA